MKVIVAGSRTILDYDIVARAIKNSKFPITEIVSGKAIGVDTLGEAYAIEHNIPVKSKPAEWGKYGRSAGPRRNEEMGHYADAAIVVWDGKSSGSAHMAKFMKSLHKPVYLLQIEAFEYEDFEKAMKQCVEMFSNEKFDYILPIPRGGLIPAAVLSYKLKIPLMPLTWQNSLLKLKVLIVDDIIDSGETIKAKRDWLRQIVADDSYIKIATLYYNVGVKDVVPDWTYRKLDREHDRQYIKFWWE